MKKIIFLFTLIITLLIGSNTLAISNYEELDFVTGIVTAQDWQRLYEVYNSVLETVAPSLGEQGYPGTPLRRGSRGDSVRLIQTYLNTISDTYPIIPKIEADGVFGQATENAVRAFQQRFFIQPTGVVDAATWGQIVEEYNFLTRQN